MTNQIIAKSNSGATIAGTDITYATIQKLRWQRYDWVALVSTGKYDNSLTAGCQNITADAGNLPIAIAVLEYHQPEFAPEGEKYAGQDEWTRAKSKLAAFMLECTRWCASHREKFFKIEFQ